MIAKKKKLSRKTIKEDKLITTYYNTREFVENNSRTIMIYAGVLVAVVAVVFFYINNRQQNNEAAALHLSRVMPIYDSGSYLEAIEGREGTNIIGLKKIVDEYGSSENGNTAKIYLANAYSFLGKHEEANEYYKDYSGGIDLYKSTAFAGQAAYQASKNNYQDAASTYRKAARVSKSNALNPDYLLRAGINYLAAGQSKDAREMFETISKDYQNTPASREVDRYMAQVSE
jgi:tetratricopeptide (TPR) repeat protein